MCRRASVWLLLLPVAVLVAVSFAGPEGGLFRVARVIDGDTIELENGERVRYIGIDTPETKHPYKSVEPFGEEAAAFNDSLVSGKIVRLETDVQVRDKYRRILAYVWVDSILINAELVKEGYAQVSTYPPNVRYEKLFLKLQTEAREAGRGLWAEDSSQDSSATRDYWREEVEPLQEEESGYFVGSKRSNKFHSPDCRYAKKIKAKNLIAFSAVKEARDAGYVPCKVCKPALLIATPKKEVEQESSPTVYITRTGSKYHRGTCNYLRKIKIPIPLKDAKARGYGPCSRCRPPR